MSGDQVSRRRALGLLVAGSASAAAGVTGWLSGAGAPPGGAVPAVSGRLLTESPVLGARQGVLDASLTAASGAAVAGWAGAGLGFNGSSPGPTLRVQPGDVLRVRLVNRLDQPTNLHTHGLHVSPEGRGDNPFVTIDPGTTFDYAIEIPPNHPPGTFWYHPHRHRFVADQLSADPSARSPWPAARISAWQPTGCW